MHDDLRLRTGRSAARVGSGQRRERDRLKGSGHPAAVFLIEIAVVIGRERLDEDGAGLGWQTERADQFAMIVPVIPHVRSRLGVEFVGTNRRFLSDDVAVTAQRRADSLELFGR